MSLSYIKCINGEDGILVAKIINKKGEKNVFYHPFHRFDILNEYDRASSLEFLGQTSEEICEKEYITLDIKKKINLEDLFLSRINHVPSSLQEKRLYAAMCEQLDLMNSRFLDLEKTRSKVIPQVDHLENQRISMFISGKSGSGKSTLVSKLVKGYLERNPGTDVYLVTRKEKDPVFDNIPELKRLMINKDFLSKIKRGIIDVDYFSDSIVIFDDWDFLQDKSSENLVRNLMDSLLNLGRSKGIHVFSIVHKSLSGVKTQTLFDEANFMAVYPSMNYPESVKALKKFLNISDKKLALIIPQYRQSRWLIVVLPSLFITEDSLRIHDL